MKNLFYLTALTFIFTNCNDDLEIINPSSVSEVDQQNLPEGDATFSDKVLNEDNEALAGAVVTVYAGAKRYSDTTDDKGSYDITVPLAELPGSGYISVSVIAEEYKPYNLTYLAPLVSGTVYDSDMVSFSLTPCPTCLEIGVKSSELIHLGDDNYGGSYNSQFQKTTDGVEREFNLEGSAEFKSLTVSVEIKGLQPYAFDDGNKSAIQFYSGEEMLSEQLLEMDAPEDGSFEVFMYDVDNSTTITDLKFITRNHGTVGSDYDDWEFTCLYVEGVK